MPETEYWLCEECGEILESSDGAKPDCPPPGSWTVCKKLLEKGQTAGQIVSAKIETKKVLDKIQKL